MRNSVWLSLGRLAALPGVSPILVSGCLVACAEREPTAAAPPEPPVEAPPALPSGAGASTPRLTADAGDGLLYTWQEPLPGGGAIVRFARYDGRAWSTPSDIARGGDVLVNWADYPGAIRGGDGAVYAWWLRAGEGQAYDLELARSGDGGTWSALDRPYPPGAPGEYGFASAVPHPEGIRLFWLDGRASPMTLRAAVVTATGFRDLEVVDDRTCDCCATDAALAAGAPIAVWRDRDEAELRDIVASRRDPTSTQVGLPPDGWRIEGCPVNGPAIAAREDTVAIAWFTGAGDAQRVRAAFSRDGARTFGPAIEVAGPDTGARPVGRVDIALDTDDTALVSWLSAEGEDGTVRLRRIRSDGSTGAPLAVGPTGTGRASGFPTLARVGDLAHLAWTTPAGVVYEAVPTVDVPTVSAAAAPSSGPSTAPTLPQFEATTRDGARHGSEELTGGPVLLNVWATWCGPCREELPDLAAFAAGRPIKVVAVSIDGPAAASAVWALSAKLAPDLEVWHASPEAAAALGVSAVPRTLLYEGSGKLVWASTGRFDPAAPDLVRALEAMGP